MTLLLIDLLPGLAYCTIGEFLPPTLTYFPRPRVRHTPHGGRASSFLHSLGSIGHGRLKARWRDSSGIVLKRRAGNLGFLFFCLDA